MKKLLLGIMLFAGILFAGAGIFDRTFPIGSESTFTDFAHTYQTGSGTTLTFVSSSASDTGVLWIDYYNNASGSYVKKSNWFSVQGTTPISSTQNYVYAIGGSALNQNLNFLINASNETGWSYNTSCTVVANTLETVENTTKKVLGTGTTTISVPVDDIGLGALTYNISFEYDEKTGDHVQVGVAGDTYGNLSMTGTDGWSGRDAGDLGEPTSVIITASRHDELNTVTNSTALAGATGTIRVPINAFYVAAKTFNITIISEIDSDAGDQVSAFIGTPLAGNLSGTDTWTGVSGAWLATPLIFTFANNGTTSNITSVSVTYNMNTGVGTNITKVEIIYPKAGTASAELYVDNLVRAYGTAVTIQAPVSVASNMANYEFAGNVVLTDSAIRQINATGGTSFNSAYYKSGADIYLINATKTYKWNGTAYAVYSGANLTACVNPILKGKTTTITVSNYTRSGTYNNLSDFQIITNIKYNGTAAGNIVVNTSTVAVLYKINAGQSSPLNSFAYCTNPNGCSVAYMAYSSDALFKLRAKITNSAGSRVAMSIYNPAGANNVMFPISWRYLEMLEFYATPYVNNTNASLMYEVR